VAVQLDTARLLPATGDVSPAVPRPSGAGAAFADTLSRILQTVDASTSEANTAIEKMLDGSVDPHEAMIALHAAETTFQVTVQIRNKFVQAYQEIMRMPV
jgi:flagellar hook-basal body complex protein FliE